MQLRCDLEVILAKLEPALAGAESEGRKGASSICLPLRTVADSPSWGRAEALENIFEWYARGRLRFSREVPLAS